MAIGYTDLPMLIAKDKANGDFPVFRKSNISVSLCRQIAGSLLLSVGLILFCVLLRLKKIMAQNVFSLCAIFIFFTPQPSR